MAGSRVTATEQGARGLRGVRKLTRADVRESAYDAYYESLPLHFPGLGGGKCLAQAREKRMKSLMENNECGFRAFLRDTKHLNETSISHYCSYIRSIVREYGLESWEKLVESEQQTRKYIFSLVRSPMFLPVPSARCYRRAMCLLYEWKNSKEIHDVSFSGSITAKLSFNESAKKSWYQTLIVDRPQEWFRFVAELNQLTLSSERCWAFRGQGDAIWGMETSLGRVLDYQKGDTANNNADRLRLFEKETMWEFKRESSKRFEYRGFGGINLLALVQHYGGRTRLLDFTLSPFLALYMSVEQNETDFTRVNGYAKLHQGGRKLKRPDFAVWAIDLSRLDNSNKKASRTVQNMLYDAEQTLESDVDNKGIHVVFPDTCNERISAQDGLFLMPKSLAHGFEENLRAELAANIELESERLQCRKLSEYAKLVLDCHISEKLPPVVKFVFPGSVISSVKRMVAEANVTAKHVYPDLTGLGKYVSGIIEEHCHKGSLEE